MRKTESAIDDRCTEINLTGVTDLPDVGEPPLLIFAEVILFKHLLLCECILLLLSYVLGSACRVITVTIRCLSTGSLGMPVRVRVRVRVRVIGRVPEPVP